MHLYKRKDSKFWWYKFEMDGVAYQGSTKTRNRRDAEGIASKARLKAIEGKYDIKRQKATPAFTDAMKQFLAYVKEQNAGRTHKRYECSSRPLIKAFGKKPLNQITPDDVEKYKNSRLAGGGEKRRLKPATVNNDLACVKALYSYFITLQTVTENPAKPVKFLPMNNEQTRVFSFEEERLYLAACEQPLHDVAVLMLDTGMRPDELYRLRRENVNLVAGTVFNPYGKSKAARRRLALTTRAADLLRARLGTGNGEYVFPDDDGRPIGDLNYLHRKALKDSGIAKARMYDLRHTFASRAVEAGVDLVTLAALMGHSKIQMVLRYAHPSEEHQLLAIRKLEEFTISKQIAETGGAMGAAAGLIN